MIEINKEHKKPDVLNGPIAKTLREMTIPMMFGMVAIMLFNIVDTFYVGKLGTKELAAMGFTFPIVFSVFSISMGIGVGTTSVISRLIGQGNKDQVRKFTTNSLILSFLIAISLSVAGLLSLDLVFSLLGAEPDTIILIKEYMSIWYLGLALLMVPMVGNSAIRATGDTKTPSIIMIVAGGVNIILDPFFIFGIGFFPRMELAGAALATLISWVATFSAGIWVLSKREKMLYFFIPKLKSLLSSWKKILYIGIPASAANISLALITGIILRMLSRYGEEAVAAYGIISRLEFPLLIGIASLSVILIPFIGQNLGAGNHSRIKKALGVSYKYSLIWGIGVFIILLIAAKPIASLFSDNEIVVNLASAFLLILSLSYGIYGLSLLTGSAFNAMKKPYHVVFIVLVRLFIFSIPLAYLGSWLYGVKGIITGVSLANIFIGIFSYFWLKKFYRVNKYRY